MLQVKYSQSLRGLLPLALDFGLLRLRNLDSSLLALCQQYTNLHRHHRANPRLPLFLCLFLLLPLFHSNDKPADLAMALVPSTVFDSRREEFVHLSNKTKEVRIFTYSHCLRNFIYISFWYYKHKMYFG